MISIRTRARIQTRAALLATAGLLAASLLGHGLSAAPSYSPDNQESAFLGLINDYRAQNGLGPLVIHDELGAAADFHSQDMATNNYFDHYLSDGSGPGDNIADFGYTGDVWGENIAAGMATASEALVGWQNSPSHNAAMLDRDYTEIGIGRYYEADSEYGWYWTTTFGGGEDEGSSTPANRAQPQITTTTTVDESTDDGVTNGGRGVDGSGDGTATTTVNGRPVRGGTVVDANGRVITTIDNNGEAPIEKITTVSEQPSVTNGGEWTPAPAPSYDTYTGEDTYASDTYSSDTYEAADTYAAEDTYSDSGESISGGDDSYSGAGEDTYATAEDAGDTYGYTEASAESLAAEDTYGSEDTYASADTYASDTYSADTYDGGSADTYDGEITYYQTIEAEQDGVIESPTINGVPVESGTFVADANDLGRRDRNTSANANGDGPTVVYGDIDGSNAPTSINADGGYNSGATTSYPGNSGSSSYPSSTTTVTSPDGSLTTTTTINGINMNDGVSTTYGNSQGRGASADPGNVTYGN